MRIRRRKRVKIKKAAALLIFSAVLFLPFRLRPAVQKALIQQINSYGTALLCAAAEENAFDVPLQITRDDAGGILSVEMDTASVNRLKGAILRSAVEKTAVDRQISFSVPLGALLGGRLFSGAGPQIPVRILSVGSVEAEIRSDFSGVGINQTIYRTLICFKLCLTADAIGVRETVDIFYDYVLGETLIVGDIPQMYVQ